MKKVITITGAIIIGMVLISIIVDMTKEKDKPTPPLFIFFPLHNTKEIIGIPTRKYQQPNFILFYRGQTISLFPFNKTARHTFRIPEEYPFGNINFSEDAAEEMINEGLKQADAIQNTSLYNLKDMFVSYLDPNNSIFQPRKAKEIHNSENLNPEEIHTPNLALVTITETSINATPFITQEKGNQEQVGVFLSYDDTIQSRVLGEVWQIIDGKLKFYTLNQEQYKVLKEHIEINLEKK